MVNSFLNKRYKAFTLAEVLITLGIIGVVAAITIPNLIMQYQKDQTAAQLKKVYSTLNQFYEKATTEEGPVSTWDWGTVANSTNSIRFVKEYILPYFSVAQDCGYNYTDTCWPTVKKGLNNSDMYPGGYHFVISDGTSFAVDIDGTNFGMYFDLNGNKGPNIYGKDNFIMSFPKNDNKIKFYGSETYRKRSDFTDNTTYGCSKASGGNGGYCGALIQFDGWKIDDTYPW